MSLYRRKKRNIMAKKNKITKVSDSIPEVQEKPMNLESTKTNSQTLVEVEGIKKMYKASGFRVDDAAMNTLVAVFNTLIEREATDKIAGKRVDQILSAMCELDPQDGLEGMLHGMLLVSYERAMECFRRANKNESNAKIYFGLQNQGIKLMRLYVQQLEALDKHRRKGNQKMVVEHIHVNEGGKAIVGNIGRGEGK
jgi:hypothetical protein